jgi:hypothetical protein
MVGVYKDPKGENIFKETSSSFSNKTVSSEEVVDLQKKVKELEDEIKKKDVRMFCVRSALFPGLPL